MAWDYSEYDRKRHQERLTWATDLLGGVCSKCGSKDRLEFDHVDPASKTACISDVVGRWSIQRLRTELTKCQLLCKPCHIDKTLADNGRTRSPHGAIRCYQNGCRCDLCVQENRRLSREYMKRYREKKKQVNSTGGGGTTDNRV